MPVLAASSTTADRGVTERFRQILITGFAITLPLLVTVAIIAFVLNFASGVLDGVVVFVQGTLSIGTQLSDAAVEALTVVVFFGVVFLVGLVAKLRSGSGIERTFDTAMARLPGIGQVYTSFNEMSELLLSNDSQSFREVKLVEFPTEGSYTLAFVTADTPDVFREATGEENMTTLFLPMAPNPVMGGHVIHVSSDRVYDVDLDVDDGIQAIVTSGVAVGVSDDQAAQPDLIDVESLRAKTPDELTELAGDDGGGGEADDQ